MKKLILALIILLLLIVGIVLYIYRVNLQCWPASSPESKDRCYSSYASQHNNLKICDKVKNGNMKANCYKSIALITQDSYTCSIIPLEDSSSPQKIDCYIELAVIKRDTSICQYIPTTEMTQRDYCKVMVAVETQDESICQNLESEEYVSKTICEKRATAGSNDIME